MSNTRRGKLPARVVALTTAVVSIGWLVSGAAQSLDEQAQAMMKSSFRDQGIAKVDRLDQDLGQQAGSSPEAPSADVAQRIVDEATATIRKPSDGRYLGDWKLGERLAQNGRGMTWSDKTTEPQANGGSCYNCHQIDKKEISHGTIGPSLYNYGKMRGVRDPADPSAAAVVEYTWGKLWNSKAFVACSNMPRFGAKGLLDESQLRDLMALLLDPKSPVNQ